jgi:hypothetical protein
MTRRNSTLSSSPNWGVIRPKDNDDVRKIKFDDKHRLNGFHLPSHTLNRFLFTVNPTSDETNAF